MSKPELIKPRSTAVARKMNGKVPKLRTKWVDFIKRELVVTKVEGAKVYGKITFSPTGKAKDKITRNYSCDLKIFEHIWMEQKAVMDPLEALKRGIS